MRHRGLIPSENGATTRYDMSSEGTYVPDAEAQFSKSNSKGVLDAQSDSQSETESLRLRLTSSESDPESPSTKCNPIDHIQLDIRSVGVFRVMLGVVHLIDAVLRVLHAEWLYSDDGLFSRADAVQLSFVWQSAKLNPRSELPSAIRYSPFSLNPYFWSGSVYWAYVLFVLRVIAAVHLIIGTRYYTRVACILTWYMHRSQSLRNGLVMSMDDQLLMMLSFWAIFLPLRASFALHREAHSSKLRVSGAVAVAMYLQVVYAFTFSVYEKMHDDLWSSHSMVYYIMRSPSEGSALANWIASLGVIPVVVYSVINLMVVLTEAIAPLVVMLSTNQHIKTIAWVSLLALQAGLAMFMFIFIFPLVSFTATIVLTPSSVWDFCSGCSAAVPLSVSGPDRGSSHSPIDQMPKPAPRTPHRRHSVSFILLWTVVILQAFGNVAHLGSNSDFRYLTPMRWPVFHSLDRAMHLSTRWSMFTEYDGTEADWPFIIATGAHRQLYDVQHAMKPIENMHILQVHSRSYLQARLNLLLRTVTHMKESPPLSHTTLTPLSASVALPDYDYVQQLHLHIARVICKKSDVLVHTVYIGYASHTLTPESTSARRASMEITNSIPCASTTSPASFASLHR
jgi:hypothetical protein